MMHRSLVAAAAALAGDFVLAHEGHGAEGPHLHGGDVAGLLLAIAAIGLVLWLRRK